MDIGPEDLKSGMGWSGRGALSLNDDNNDDGDDESLN